MESLNVVLVGGLLVSSLAGFAFFVRVGRREGWRTRKPRTPWAPGQYLLFMLPSLAWASARDTAVLSVLSLVVLFVGSGADAWYDWHGVP
jgi:hypothetical protein